MQCATGWRRLAGESPAFRDSHPVLHAEGKVQQPAHHFLRDGLTSELSPGTPFLQDAGEFIGISFPWKGNGSGAWITLDRRGRSLALQQILHAANFFRAYLFAIGIFRLHVKETAAGFHAFQSLNAFARESSVGLRRVDRCRKLSWTNRRIARRNDWAVYSGQRRNIASSRFQLEKKSSSAAVSIEAAIFLRVR